MNDNYDTIQVLRLSIKLNRSGGIRLKTISVAEEHLDNKTSAAG